MLKKQFLCSLMAIFVMTSSSWADPNEPLKSPSKVVDSANFELDTTIFLPDLIVIQSSRVNEKTPLTYSEVDASSIRKNNTGIDLPYLLRQTPSLVVTSDAGAGVGYTGLRVRGSDLTRINVTLNGVPVNGAEDHQVYFVDLPDLASSVDNIQIQRGVGTSANGAAAFGASLNIKTDAATSEPSSVFSSSAGSFHTLKNTLNFSTGRSEKGFCLNGRLSKIKSDGYVDRASSNLDSYYLSGSWSDKNNILKAIILHGKEKTYQAWNGIPKSMVASNPTYNPAGEMYDHDGNFIGFYDNETDNYTQTYYQLHYAHTFNDNLTLTSSLYLTTGEGYYENYYNNRCFSDYGRLPFVIGDSLITSSNLIHRNLLDNYLLGFNFSLNHQTGRFNTTYGGGWNTFHGDHFGRVIWAEYGFPNDFEWFRNTGLKTDANVFAKTNVNLTEKLSGFADLQYRHIDYTISGIHEDLRDISQEHHFDFFNPKAGLFLSLNEHHSIYASAALSHREPNRTVYELADNNQIESVKPEKLIDYELGYRLSDIKYDITANLFYMDYTDQLVLTGEINSVGASIMTNVDDSYRYGLELAASYQPIRQIAVSGHLSLSRNKILNFKDYIEDWDNGGNHVTELGTTDISFSPDVVGGFTMSYFPVKSLSISAQGTYVGRQFIDNTSCLERSLDPYFLCNVLVNYEWEQELFKTLNLYASANNIFNTHYCSNAWVYRAYTGGAEYLEDGYFPQAGFNFMIGLTIGY